jgi:methionyl-tRNA synthetase
VLGAHRINAFKPLKTRIDPEKVSLMIEESKTPVAPDPMPPTRTVEPLAPQISIDDFAKIDLRVALVVDAKEVAGADKLIELKLDVGNEVRSVFAGIKSAYRPLDLVGRQVVLVANLAPRKMRFGTSEGMILVAGGDGQLFVISPEQGALPGMRVK